MKEERKVAHDSGCYVLGMSLGDGHWKTGGRSPTSFPGRKFLHHPKEMDEEGCRGGDRLSPWDGSREERVPQWVISYKAGDKTGNQKESENFLLDSKASMA